MDLNNVLLTLAGVLPAMVLCIYIYRRDRVEKEPVALLVQLFSLGALCCLPAAYAEDFVIAGIEMLFEGSIVTDVQGNQFLPIGLFYVYNFLKYFVGVALIEELMKWLALNIATRRNEEFNCLFDGLVYAIFVSLGFAAYENLLYVLQYGWVNAFMRGVLAVPGHMFFAVMMGWYYSLWHITEKARKEERRLKKLGVIDADAKEFSIRGMVWLSILMPVLFHGIYDYCCTLNRWWAVVVFYAFVGFMYIYCFRKIKTMSAADDYDGSYVTAMLTRKYPHIKDEQAEKIGAA